MLSFTCCVQSSCYTLFFSCYFYILFYMLYIDVYTLMLCTICQTLLLEMHILVEPSIPSEPYKLTKVKNSQKLGYRKERYRNIISWTAQCVEVHVGLSDMSIRCDIMNKIAQVYHAKVTC